MVVSMVTPSDDLQLLINRFDWTRWAVQSSVWHVLLDVTGGLAGFLLAWLAAYAWGNEAFRSMHAPDGTETPQLRS